MTVKKPGEIEPGIRVFSPRRRIPGKPLAGYTFGMLLAVNEDGEPVWYYRSNSRISDLERLQNGHFMFLTQDYRLVEVDLLGNVVSQYYAKRRPQGPLQDAIPIDTLAIHHEVDELPNGNLLVLGVEMRELDNYYRSEYDPNAPRKRQKVMGDEIIEITRDGKEVWRWRAFDHLDPYRIGYETFSDFWVRRGFPDTVDWSHANSMLYDPSDDSILVSFRYQAAIVKIDHKTGEIRWILGEHSGWPNHLKSKLLRPVGQLQWFYHQHAPVPTPHGTILLFNNESYGTRPFTPPLPPTQTYSRAVEYKIDEKNMTVEQVWVSEGPGPDAVVSFAMGDVDWLPKTGHVLVHYGMLIARPALKRFNGRNAIDMRTWSHIREYTHTSPPELVWELIVGDPEGLSEWSWTIYGGELLPSLYPEDSSSICQ